MEYTIGTIAPIILFPLVAFVINAFCGRKLPRQGDWISCIAIFLSFLWCARIFCDFYYNQYSSDFYIHKVFNWIDLSWGTGPSKASGFKVDMGIFIDNVAAIMLLMVSGVASLIHLFSTFYMKGDPKYGKFFVYLSLFSAAMLGLVLSDNLLSVFIFWEIMGFCSYSLIGFYHEKNAAGDASLKAFMTTRVGDVCFLLGILAIWSIVGNVNFVDIYQALHQGSFTTLSIFNITISAASFAGLMIFLGTIGKSAQFPLQVWLPDAMMGPTPCSALIHAATMVAAGVYLSLRMYPLMEAGDLTTLIAFVGAITAFGAATIALVQTDIKAVLAFSTISQLGYMVMGIGVGAYSASFMHLITHAIFKACLFLSAGSVIHSLHDHHTHGHVQEMPRMGGLKKKLPFTFFAMTCCTLAIAGVPFFSGFVSKDRILGDALYWGSKHGTYHWIVPLLGFSAAFLTAFYMFRMMYLTFYGTPRDQAVYDSCHQEKLSFNRNIPLLILSVFTLGIFFSGSLTGQQKVKLPIVKFEWFETLVQKPQLFKFSSFKKENFGLKDTREIKALIPSVYGHNQTLSEQEAHETHHAHFLGAIISIILAFSGILLAFLMYLRKSLDPSNWVNFFPRWTKALKERYYFDYLYQEILIKKVLLRLNYYLAKFDLDVFDRIAIDGWQNVSRCLYRAHRVFDEYFIDRLAVDGSGKSIRLFNMFLRYAQTGKVQIYFLIFLVVLISYLFKLKI